MIYVGIDVAKHKHDCYIVNSDGEIIKDVFTISNDLTGFSQLLDSIPKVSSGQIKIGLEATGHYSINLLNFLKDHYHHIVVFNPLQTNLFRKAHTLRKNKTDKIDARFIALMLHSNDYNSYSDISYHLQDLKSLSRHRFRLKSQSSKLKISLTRLITIMFPELPSVVYSIHQKSTYTLLEQFPSKSEIAKAHLTTLINLLHKASKGKYSKDKAILIRDTARTSIGSDSRAISFELKQTLRLINSLQDEINSLDLEIKALMNEIQSPITSIPGISNTLGSMILSEIGDISRFDTPAQLQAFAGLEPSTHQSGNFTASNSRMVKRGSKYLRWALLEAARLIVMRDTTFKLYYQKKKAEGKHHYVAQSHVAKKLIRVIFHLLSNNLYFLPQIV